MPFHYRLYFVLQRIFLPISYAYHRSYQAGLIQTYKQTVLVFQRSAGCPSCLVVSCLVLSCLVLSSILGYLIWPVQVLYFVFKTQLSEVMLRETIRPWPDVCVLIHSIHHSIIA